MAIFLLDICQRWVIVCCKTINKLAGKGIKVNCISGNTPSIIPSIWDNFMHDRLKQVFNLT